MATRKRSWQKKKCRTLAHFAVGRQSSGEYGTVYGKLNIQLAKWTFRYHFSPILLESFWIQLTNISIAFLGKYLEIHVTYTLTKNSIYRIKLSSLRRAQGQRILLEFYFVGTSLVYVTNIQCFFFLYTNPSLPNIISTFWLVFVAPPVCRNKIKPHKIQTTAGDEVSVIEEKSRLRTHLLLTQAENLAFIWATNTKLQTRWVV